ELRQPLRERQSQAAAADLPLDGAIHLREFLEDEVGELRGDADTSVGNREYGGLAVAGEASRNADLATLSELQRVRNEIAQNLNDLVFIGIHRRHGRRVFEDQLDILIHLERPQYAAQPAEETRDLENRRAHHGFA